MSRLILYCLTLFCLHSSAQILPFKTYTVKDGLLSQQINVLTRDKKGILWIGTPFGINWFDGQQFSEPSITTRSGQLYVTNFYEDSRSRTWVLTFYNGIYKYENDHFTNYIIDSVRIESTSNNVFDMVEYDSGMYIVATDHNIYWFDGNKFRLFDPGNKELSIQFNSITLINKNEVLFGSSKGVFVYRKINNRWTFAGKILPDLTVGRIKIFDRRFWVATSTGVYLYETTNDIHSSKHSKILFKGIPIQSINRNKLTSEIWVCADKVYRLNGNAITTITKQNGLPAIPGNVFFDNENITWLCSAAGLIKLAKQNYIFHDLTKTGVNSMITALTIDSTGNLWAGTYDGLFKKNQEEYVRYDLIGNDRIGYVSWLYTDTRGIMHAGTNAGLLTVQNGIIKKTNDRRTTKIFGDENGILWIGSENGKIYRMANGIIEDVNIEPILIDFVDGIYKKENVLWLGYRGAGIIKYIEREGVFRKAKEYSSNTGYRDMRIRCVGTDQNGNLLWGTRTNGLFVIAKDESQTWSINTNDGLSANWVKSIMLDDNKAIYLATNKGVNVLSGSYDAPSIRKINILNENISHETSYIYPTDENILIGTEQGVLEYIPKQDVADTTPPRIYITQLTINGKRDSTLSPYSNFISERRLDHNSNVLALEFTGINMKDEQRVFYSYILEGQDNTWSVPGERNFVSYNLPPGKYNFKVRAVNNTGVWSKETANFPFVIATPFWKRWWFLFAITLLVVSLAFFLYRYRLKQQLKLEKLRSRISTDLHDDIGSTLSSISILSEMALKESNSRESEDMMIEIKNNSVLLMEKMDDIVWSINPKNDSLENLLIRIRSFSARLFEAKNIEYSISIDDSVKHAKLSMESRQHIYLMLKEAINNLVKYSKCTQAIIQVKFQNNMLYITVTDNGVGFDKRNVRTGNGLLNMQTRADMLKADMTIETSPGAGTSIIWSGKIK